MRKITKFFNTKATSIDEDAKTVTFAISNTSVDRMGEVVDQKSWDFKDYQNNPQFLWGHNPEEPENVLGQCLDLKVSDDGSETLGTFQFDTDINTKADLVFKQVKRGSLRTVSVGFINDSVEYVKGIPHLMGNKLLEVSVVPIPANATALAKDFKAGVINRKDLKWLKESFESELEFVNKELAKEPESENDSMDEVTKKQLGALLEAVAKLANSQEEITSRLDELDIKSKGAVTDIVNADDSWEVEDAKWANMSVVSGIYYALCEAYYYTATPVDQFPELLKEFIQLIQAVADGNYEKSAEGLINEKVVSHDENHIKEVMAQLFSTKSQDAGDGDDATTGGPDEMTDTDPTEKTKAVNATTEDTQATDEVNDDEGEQSTEDAAKGGDNDQPGAAADDELDLDAELTPDLKEQIDKQVEEAVTA